MATLKQNENYNSTFLGWYGKCGQPECTAFDLGSVTTIAKVYQFTEDGVGIRTYVPNAPQYMQAFHELKCGNSYWIVLKPGTSSVDIPEFIQGQHSVDGKNLGMISSDCGLRVTDTKPFTDDEKECDCDDDTTTPIKPCTKDVRICSDGSTVARDGANECHFPPCNFSMIDYKDASTRWKLKQPTYYKFNFAWSCYCTELATRQVTITVKYGKVVHIETVGTSEEISLGQNEGTETESDKPPVPFKYLSVEGLFRWVANELKKHPFSIVATYDDTYGYMKGAFVDRIQEMADEELGFHVSAFEELSFDGNKCPSDYKKCPDGTLLKRDPDNNCRFPECPDVPDETPKSVSDIPKLKFRWLTRGSRSTLQVANAINPWSGSTEDKYLSWRTVYGSRVVNPKEINSSHWKPLYVDDAYLHEFNISSWKYSDIEFSIDKTNNNHIMVTLGQTNEFIPNPDEIESSSHLYVFKDDSEKSLNKSWTFPVIMKNKSKISGVMGCPEDVKICPDGSTLTRNFDNDCEFDDCDGDIGFAAGDEETPFSIEEGFGDFAPTPTSGIQFADDDATPTPVYDSGDIQLTDDDIELTDDDIDLGIGFDNPTPTPYADFADDDSSDDADDDVDHGDEDPQDIAPSV